MENKHLETAKLEVGKAGSFLLSAVEHIELAKAEALIAIADELHEMNRKNSFIPLTEKPR